MAKAKDESSNVNGAIIVNGPVFQLALGFYQGDVRLDGDGDFLEAPFISAYDLTTKLTLEAHIKPASAEGLTQIISRRNNTANTIIYELRMTTDRKIRFSLQGTSGPLKNLLSATSIPLDSFTHIAGTYDKVKMRIFIDGVEDASVGYNKTLKTGSFGIFIGAKDGSTGQGQFFNGEIDEVRISDIARIYSGVPNSYTSDANTVGLWLLNDKPPISIRQSISKVVVVDRTMTSSTENPIKMDLISGKITGSVKNIISLPL